MRDSSNAAVLETQSKLGRPLARGDNRLEPCEQRLEVDVPDPRHVAAVGDRIVQRDDGNAGRAAVEERADDFVGTGGVLDQEQEQPLAVDGNAFEAAERGAEPGESLGDLVKRRAESLGERRRTDRVVDVVEPGQSELDAPRALRRDEVERGALEAVQLDRPGGHVERRPRVSAVRAVVVAEVADVDRAVVIRRSAAHAVLRVGRVLERRAGEARIVEAEDDRVLVLLGERSDLRVVAVHDEPVSFARRATASRQRSATSSSSP